MDALKIKYQNQICTICACTFDMHTFLKTLEEKLKLHFFHKKEYFHAFFSFPFSLSENDLLSLYELCDLYHTIIDGFIQSETYEQLTLMDHAFHNGNQYHLTKEVIYIGDIERDVYITTSHNLYVIGNVYGKIDCLYPHLSIHASSLQQCAIRFYDTKFQIMTNHAPCSVYYEKGNITYK